MTTTTDRTNTVPKWLDLDQIVPKEVQDELAAIAEEMAMLKPQVSALAQRAFAAEQECEAFIGKVTAEVDKTGDGPEAVDGLRTYLYNLAGAQRVFMGAVGIADEMAAWTGVSGDAPEWLKNARFAGDPDNES